MRILTRYILREVTAHALIGAAIFTFVLFTRDLGHILELVVRASAPLPSVAEIFSFTVPLALTYTLPMSVLVGILIGLSRLAADSEITAMRASGMGVWSFLRVLSIFVVAAWLLALSSTASTSRRARRPRSAISKTGSKARRFPSKSSRASSTKDFPRYVLYVQDVKSAQGAAVWKGVFMADLSDARQPKDHAGQRRHRRQRRPGPPASASDRRFRARNRSQRCQTLPDLHVPADRHPDRTALHREQARRIASRRA